MDEKMEAYGERLATSFAQKLGKTVGEVRERWEKQFEGDNVYEFDGTYVFTQGHVGLGDLTGYAKDGGVEPSHFGEPPFRKFTVMFKEIPFGFFIGYEELDERGDNTSTGVFTPWQKPFDFGPDTKPIRGVEIINSEFDY